MYCISVRRYMKWNFTRSAQSKRNKTPLTFNQCVSDGTSLDKRCKINPWIIILVITPFFYYIIHQKSNPEIISIVNEDVEDIEERPTLECTYSTTKERTPKLLPMTNIIHNLNKTKPKEVKNGSKATIKLMLKPSYMDDKDYNKLPTCLHKNVYEKGVTTPSVLSNPDKAYQDVKMGGYYRPKDCNSRHKVALLVPYRDRKTNLAIFIFNIHPFLIRQNLEYRVFVIEQYGKSKFNKGRLYNAGFNEIQKYGSWQCVIFHDLDLIPVDDRIKYTCPIFPRHMCGEIIEKQRIHQNSLFGGVTAMSLSHYKLVNGYSNNFWGWGGEDHDMFWRLRYVRLPIMRYMKNISKYVHITHPRGKVNPNRYNMLNQYLKKYKVDEQFKKEGLSTVLYKVISTKFLHLYTHIVVNIDIQNKSKINKS